MTIKAVVFDMGGVVVELGPVSDILGTVDIEPDEFWKRWLKSDAVRSFEMGKCDEAAFADGLSQEFGIDGSEFVSNFAAWPKGLYPGAEDLVRSLHDEYIVCCLSNTNALHWDSQIGCGVLHTLFQREYLSYRMGLAKPDAAIFEAMIDDLKLDAHEVLFLDDNQPNVAAAERLGIIARRVVGPVEARAACEEILRF